MQHAQPGPVAYLGFHSLEDCLPSALVIGNKAPSQTNRFFVFRTLSIKILMKKMLPSLCTIILNAYYDFDKNPQRMLHCLSMLLQMNLIKKIDITI